MAQTVIGQLPKAAVQVRTQVRSFGSSFPCKSSLYYSLHTHLLSIVAGTIGPVVAGVPRCLSLIPSKLIKFPKTFIFTECSDVTLRIIHIRVVPVSSLCPETVHTDLTIFPIPPRQILWWNNTLDRPKQFSSRLSN